MPSSALADSKQELSKVPGILVVLGAKEVVSIDGCMVISVLCALGEGSRLCDFERVATFGPADHGRSSSVGSI